MREFMENELLPVKNRVAMCVKHKVFGVPDEPHRADAVVRTKVGEFYDSKRSPAALLEHHDQCVEAESAAQREVFHGR
ncbi:hypothetical protein [Microbacterium atlanticum]|uniref:hypothetical protein n=1 Tax=Microbacterium atlanticum TaxID=2782168 RepID=UPI001E439950|nr:hypothetical protein [Microbacterium atlanticum]